MNQILQQINTNKLHTNVSVPVVRTVMMILDSVESTLFFNQTTNSNLVVLVVVEADPKSY